MASRNKKKYPKILSRPIDLRECRSLAPDAEENFIKLETAKRLAALFEHYNLNRRDHSDYFALVVKLSKDTFRGFDVVTEGNKQGRQRNRDFVATMDLMYEVETKIRLQKAMSPSGMYNVAWACGELVKQGKYPSFKTGKSLETWYYEGKKAYPFSDEMLKKKEVDPTYRFSALVALGYLGADGEFSKERPSPSLMCM
jgi:hypothetical protein